MPFLAYFLHPFLHPLCHHSSIPDLLHKDEEFQILCQLEHANHQEQFLLHHQQQRNCKDIRILYYLIQV